MKGGENDGLLQLCRLIYRLHRRSTHFYYLFIYLFGWLVGFFFETGFLCVALADLELTL